MIPSSHFPALFISQKDILEILNLFSSQGLVVEKYSSEISNFLFPYPVPHITKHAIYQIEDQLHKQKTITESLIPIKDIFRYDSNKITLYTKNFQTLSKNPSISTILVIYLVISFLSTPDFNSMSSSFENLLEAIVLTKRNMPRNYYVFSLLTCITRFVENDHSSLFNICKLAFRTVQSDIFELFTYLLVKVLRNSDQESYEYLLTSLYDSVLQNPSEFETINFLKILSFLSQKVLSFDVFALNLIDSLTYVREKDKDIHDILDSIPLYFEQHIPTVFRICEIDLKQGESNQFFRFSYNFERKSYFTNGLVPLASELFDRNFPISVDIEKVLTSMAHFLQNLENGYFEYFFNKISISNDLVYLVYVKLLTIFAKRIKMTDSIYDRIFSSAVVFSPAVTLFDYRADYNNIFSLRTEVFNFIIKYHRQLVIQVLLKFGASPLLFAEFIGRLHCNLSLFDTSLLANEAFKSCIVQVLMILKKDNSEPYQKARSTVDLFLFSLFKDDFFIRNNFFESSIFVSGYFTSIFEPTLRSSIIDSYLTFLQNFDSSQEQLKPSIEMISTVINFCEDVEMALSILHSFTEILSINQKIKSYIAPFIESITAFLHLHPSQKFLNETIQLYLHCEHQFEMRQIRDLSDSIHKINGDNDPDDQLVLNFLCLISNSPSASLHNRFSIFNEALLISFFSIFQSPQKARPIFDLFYELCKYSPFNCYKCNKAEVDLLFIEMLKNYPLKFSFRGCRMNSCIIDSKRQIIEILCLILTVRSSIPVCIKMISIFKLSSIESDVLNILLSHLVSIRKNIQPIGFCNSEIESFENGIRGKDIDNGFSLQFWLKIDESICHYSSSVICLLSIIDDHIKINFKINNNGSLLAEVKSSETVHTAILESRFPSGVWNFIALAFKRPEKSKGYLYFSLNGDKYDRYTMKEMSHFSHNYATIKIGRIESMKPIKYIFPIFLGDYFFYSRKLKHHEIVEYYQKGELQPDFIFRSKRLKKSIFPTFLDNFISCDVHHFILPYFYLNSDSKFVLPTMFLETLINILNVSISYNEKIDLDFKVYSYALKKSDKLTFTLYQRFVSILQNSITLKTMKSLVYDILLNFEIWTAIKEPSHLYRITQHWGNSLFDSCSSVLTNFAIIFSQIPVYFTRNRSIDIDLCRQGIDKLLLSIASVSFTNENAIAILSHCAASDDLNQLLCNFDLLYRISLIRDDISISICELLFYFLKPQKEKQFVAALKIIYQVSKLKFPKFVDSILCLFNEFYITEELLDLLLKILPDFPMIYPLVIFIAINLKSGFDLSVITQILKSLKIPCLAANWLLMPLILFSITKSVDIVLFCASNMIDHFSIDAFEHSLTYIDFLSSILDFNFDDFTLKFAKINVDFMNSENILEVQTMFSLCLRLLLISNQQTFSFIDSEQLRKSDDVKYSIFDSKDFDFDSSFVFNFESSFNGYLKLIQKDLSNQTFFFRIIQNPLMMSVIRIFQVAKIDIPLFQKFYQFFVLITREKKKSRMKLALLESLNSLFPYYYANACSTIHENIVNFQRKQIEYWSNAMNDSIKFMTSFGREEASIAVSNTDFLKDGKIDKLIEIKLRKNVFSQFSIWSHKKLYLTEIRRVFQYSNMFHQIRLKKSANLTNFSSFYLADQNGSNSSIKNLNPNSNLNSSSNSNSNVSSNQDSDYSSSLSDTPNSYQTVATHSHINLNSNDLSENAFFKSKCLMVKIGQEIPAEFTLEPEKFIVKTNSSQKVVMLYEISHIFKKNRFQIENSIEFILVNGRSILLDFSPLNSSTVLSQFRNLRCDNLKTFENSTPHKAFENSGLIEKWKNREISNFEYLMALNIYAGRSFKDSNLYPIFPWILTNYSSFESTFPSSYSTEFASPKSSPSKMKENKPKSKRKLEMPKCPNSSPYFHSIFKDKETAKQPNQVQEQKDQHEEQKDQHEEQKEQHEEQKDQHEEQKDQHEEQKDQHEEQKEQHEEQKEQHEEQKDQHEEQKEQHEEQKDQHEEQKEQHEEQKDQHEEQKDQHEEQKDQHEEQKDQHEEQKEQHEEQKDQHEEQKDQHEEQKDQHEEQKDQHEEQKEQHEEQKDQHEEQKEQHEEQKEQHEEQKDQHEEQKDQHEEQKDQHEEQKEQHEEQKDQHEEQKDHQMENELHDTLTSDSESESETDNDNAGVDGGFYSNRVMNRSSSYVREDAGYRAEKRNLSKPIAIQTEEKFHEFNLKFSSEHPISHSNCFFLVSPSSTAIVAHWLIRQPPFTQLHLKTENGKFGYPTRLFQTMSRAVYQALNGTISWELCPEFFCFPEIFVNMNMYKLGNNVKNDVFSLHKSVEFVYIHRKILESEEVSACLNNWIDLIFGNKTKSVESGNVYSPILCDNVWKTCSSKYSKNFIVDMLKTAGQLPQSMFSKSHPKRNLLVSPYSKNKTIKNQRKSDDKNISISSISSFMVSQIKQRQKLQSKIYILTDKVDVNDLLLRERTNILSILNGFSENIELDSNQDLKEAVKIKHATFLKKIVSESDAAEKSEEYLFLVEICDFVFGTLSINFDSKSCHLDLSSEKNYKHCKRDLNNWKCGNEKDILYSDFKYGFIVANSICNEIFIVKKSSIKKFSKSIEKEKDDENDIEINDDENNGIVNFDFLSTSGDEFSIGNSDGKFDVFYLNKIEAKPFSFHFLYERVSCFCLSQSYGVIVIGTVNGFIYIVDSKSGLISFRCSVLDKNGFSEKVGGENDSNDLANSSSSSNQLFESSASYFRDGKIPKKILITDGFGFIVVYCDDLSVFVFNINGALIRKRKLNFSVKILFSFKSNSGFDFIVAADSKGGIRFCEAFYLDFDESPIYICRSEILSISYDLPYDAILVVTKNGGFFRIPTNTNQWIY
ncbi:hypothetical protein M9Y10_021828 [Tritrichomonas musculus]|uniref:BEACH domain-containing protein n=1 Tax=Tritrichomonas musculus TaxID=1915356 RepID=A0ABR2KQH8_9EUKA